LKFTVHTVIYFRIHNASVNARGFIGTRPEMGLEEFEITSLGTGCSIRRA